MVRSVIRSSEGFGKAVPFFNGDTPFPVGNIVYESYLKPFAFTIGSIV